ncbi:hypothetical protein COHA_001327 [Chlorella ohadii]|uniref:Uncharacterized protein n=1 Tax=Chlorella ohadii TaxID=2649997 RepID=A0AAD5H9H3_9CHLO|nr:hypothetical protein COHA_001327 [Chlorella ohadii]
MRPLCSALALLLAVMLLGAAPAAEGRRPVVPQRPGGGLPLLGSDAASCDNVCDYRALPDPEKPSTSTTNTAKGVRVIMTGIFQGMKQWKGISVKIIGGLGAGVMSGISGLGKGNPAWETYKLEKYIQQSTDLLLCKMDAMVKDLNTAADQRMNEQNLYSFNNGLQAIIETFYESCGAMNCLNYTKLAPSKRSAYDLDCAYDKGPNSACPKRGSFNSKKPVYCKFDEGGTQYQGLCDPTNGHCYDVYKYDMAVAKMRHIVDLFASKDTVNNFNALNQFYDVKATVSLAKGALAKMLMLQQLIMLYGSGGDNGQLLQFVSDMADKLEARYNATLDPKRLFNVVNGLSRPNNDHNSYSPETVSWPYAREFLGNCDCTKNFNTGKSNYWQTVRDNDRVTIKAQIRKRCDEPGRIVESQCRPVKDYFSECGRYSTTVPGDWSCKKDVYMEKNCPGARDRCVEVDNTKGDWSDFVGPFADLQQWRAKLARDRCPDVVTSVNSSIWEGAYSLADELKADLEDVKEGIAQMRNIVRAGGMPQASFGVLRDFYPLLAGRCAPRNWNLTMSGGVRGVGEQEGSWLGRRCPTNCLSCRPSWRCLQCRSGYRLALDGLSCIIKV